MSLPQFKLLRPRTLEEALSLLAKHAGAGSPASTPSGGGGHGPDSLHAAKAIRARVRARYPAHCRAQGHSSRRTGVEIGALTSLTAIEQSRSAASPLSRAHRSRRHCRFAPAAQYGHDRRKHLSRHPLPLVQPVAYLAQRLWLLHQERWRSLPRRSRWNQHAGPPSPATLRRRCCA